MIEATGMVLVRVLSTARKFRVHRPTCRYAQAMRTLIGPDNRGVYRSTPPLPGGLVLSHDATDLLPCRVCEPGVPCHRRTPGDSESGR